MAFGDSWPEGDHCGRCRTFAGQWADTLATTTGREIDFNDLTGQAEPGVGESETSGSLATSLKSNPVTRAAAASADIILIATGPNDLELIFAKLQNDTCGGAKGEDCIRALGKTWNANFETILTEIEALRAGRPTAIRLVDAANAFVSEPDMAAGMPPGFATTKGALIYQELKDAICRSAARHHAVCVDVRPILSGSAMDQVVDENSPESMRAVAAALAATGLPELQ